MNKLKKISIVIIVIMIFGGVFVNKVYGALLCNVGLSASKSDLKYGDEFSVYVKISNLQTDKGIIAIGGVLSYDTKSLTLVDIEGENKWSDPFHSESTGKLTSVKNKRTSSDENVLKINFKVNDKAEKSAWVKISNFEISDGDEEKNVGGNSINLTIKGQEVNKPSNNTQNNGSKPNAGGTSKPSTNNKPSTGTSNKGNTNTNNVTNTVSNEITEENIAENIVEENTEQNNSMQNIFKDEIEEIGQDETKKQENKKTLIYVACGFGVVAIIIIAFYVIKYLKKNKESK